MLLNCEQAFPNLYMLTQFRNNRYSLGLNWNRELCQHNRSGVRSLIPPVSVN